MKYVLRVAIPLAFVPIGAALDAHHVIVQAPYWALYGAFFGTWNYSVWVE